MGLFDSVDTTIEGAYSGYGNNSDIVIPKATDLFPTPTILTDGQSLIDQRANTSFWSFDQSKITASLGDVLGSVTQAATKTGVQLASDAINRNTNNSNPTIAAMFRNFQSTQTGAQIQAGAIATRAQNWLMNPMLWLGVVVIAIFFLVRK